MSDKAPKVESYTVTAMQEDGEIRTQTAEAKKGLDVPKKGDSFEYEHHEVRIAQVIKVVATYDDGTVVEQTELGDTHHAIIESDGAEDEEVDLTDPDAAVNAAV